MDALGMRLLVLGEHSPQTDIRKVDRRLTDHVIYVDGCPKKNSVAFGASYESQT